MIVDYYMGCETVQSPLPLNNLWYGQFNKSIAKLDIGDSFIVANASERLAVLSAAARLGVKVASVKRNRGGYNIIRVKDGPKRKRGRPKLHEYD